MNIDLLNKIHQTYDDGANPSFIRSLKLQIGEDPDYDKPAILISIKRSHQLIISSYDHDLV